MKKYFKKGWIFLWGAVLVGMAGMAMSGSKASPPSPSEDGLIVRNIPYGFNAYVSSTAFTVTVTTVTQSAGYFAGYMIVNPTSNVGPSYCQFFDTNTTSGITVGTTLPKFIIAVASGTAAGAGIASMSLTAGIYMQNGIYYACTANPMDGTNVVTSLYGTLIYR